jgi:Lrp/AsnC family transcriptional regulator, leucine-responsive regulatory protein
MPRESKQKSLLTYRHSDLLLEPTNLSILQELQDNPRLTMSELARRVGMSAPAVTERVRRLEEAGVIRGYRLDLDPRALGLPLTAIVRVRPSAGYLPKIAELAESIPEVIECHRVTGEDCFIMTVLLPGLEQLDLILDQFLRFGTTTTSLVQSSPVPYRALPLHSGSD